MKKLSVFLIVFIALTTFSYAEQLKVTKEHPFYLDGEWVEAKDLKPGDKLKTIDGKTAVIKNIEKVEEPITVYNLEASSPHNYFASNVLVHNKADVNRGSLVSLKERVRKIIATEEDMYHKGDEFAEIMTKATLDSKPTPSNFHEEFRRVASARIKAAIAQGDDATAHDISKLMRMFDDGVFDEKTSNIFFTKKRDKRYNELFNKINRRIFENPDLEAGSIENLNLNDPLHREIHDSYVWHLVRGGRQNMRSLDGARVYTESTRLAGSRDPINYLILELDRGGARPMYVSKYRYGKESMFIIKRMNYLWGKAQTAPTMKERAKFLNEFRWWGVRANLVGRGGKSITEAMELSLRLKNGMPLRKGFSNWDFDVLTRPKDPWVMEQVAKDLTCNP